MSGQSYLPHPYPTLVLSIALLMSFHDAGAPPQSQLPSISVLSKFKSPLQLRNCQALRMLGHLKY